MKAVTALCVLLSCVAFAAEVKVERLGSVLRFTTEGQTILDYQMQPGEVPAGTAPIFKHGAHLHPVYSPSGKLVTGNHPEDHPHQRGIWIAWTKTEFGDSHPDFWNQGKTETKGKDKAANEGALLAEVRFDKLVKSWGGPEEGGFISEHRFIDLHDGTEKDVLRETWEVRVSRQTLGDREANVIDLTSTQTCAGDTPLRLPQYHYGGLGVRGNLAWNPVDAVTMLTSEGHDRAAGDATKAKWVHMGGQVDGAPTGMVVLIHPSNFRFPQPLRLNPKNPQLCVAPSQDGDWAIEPGKPYVSKYRILVVDGPADAAWSEAQWKAYAEVKPSTIEK
jgi:hypothetical protein